MLLSIIGTLFLLSVIWWYISKPKNLPPGPNGIPILGCLPWLLINRNRRCEYFTELSQHYKSQVICLRIGFSYILVLNSLECIKEAFTHKGDAFSGRGIPILRDLLTQGKGLITAEGPHLRENRRFLLRILRDFGSGKIKFENHILIEVDQLCEQIDHLAATGKVGKGVEIHDELMEAVANNITAITFGKHLDRSEVKLLTNQLSQLASVPAGVVIINAIPQFAFLKDVPGLRTLFGIQHIVSVRKPLEQFVQGLINEHKSAFSSDSLTDVVHVYIDEQKKHEGTEDYFWWDDDQVMHSCTELLIAGTDTTKTTIAWGLNLLALHPELQQKVQEELDSVVGRDRRISTRDQTNLPFTEATILDIFRFSSLSPTAIPHAVTEPTQLYGYDIPQGCMVLPNLLQVARDPSVWTYPDDFNPQAHFLNPTGDTVMNRDKIAPFSVGRRSCIGESLARMEVFLFITNILQQYHVSLPPDVKLDLGNQPGLIRSPHNFAFVFIKRQ